MRNILGKFQIRKLFFFGIAGLIALVFIGTAVFLYAKSIEDPIVYKTEQSFLADIVKKTVATGKITPRREIAIKSQASGVVETIFVQPGQRVHKGDLLVKIQIIPDMERLNAAELQFETARINLKNAGRELNLESHQLEFAAVDWRGRQ